MTALTRSSSFRGDRKNNRLNTALKMQHILFDKARLLVPEIAVERSVHEAAVLSAVLILCCTEGCMQHPVKTLVPVHRCLITFRKSAVEDDTPSVAPVAVQPTATLSSAKGLTQKEAEINNSVLSVTQLCDPSLNPASTAPTILMESILAKPAPLPSPTAEPTEEEAEPPPLSRRESKIQRRASAEAIRGAPRRGSAVQMGVEEVVGSKKLMHKTVHQANPQPGAGIDVTLRAAAAIGMTGNSAPRALLAVLQEVTNSTVVPRGGYTSPRRGYSPWDCIVEDEAITQRGFVGKRTNLQIHPSVGAGVGLDFAAVGQQPFTRRATRGVR